MSTRLLLYLPLILVGAGLLRRYALARTLAMGVLLFLSFAFILVPALLYWSFSGSWQASLQVLIVLGFLPIPVFGRVMQNLPILITVSAVLMMTFSFVAYRLYRHLQREDVAAEFGQGGWLGKSLVFGAWDVKVYLVAALCCVLVAAPVLEGKRQQSARQSEQEIAYALRLIGQVQFSADGQSIAVASDTETPELLIGRLSEGTITKKPFQTYGMNGAQPWNGRTRDQLWMRLSRDNRLFFSESPGRIGFANLQTDEVRKVSALDGRSVLAIGFRRESNSYLYYVPASLKPGNAFRGGKLELLDIASDRVLYSVDASRPEWLEGEDGINVLPEAVRKGVLSPDRHYYAYVYRERLHILSTEKGELSVVDAPLDKHDQIFFCKEGDAIIVNRYSGSEPTGAFHVIGSQTIQKHALHGAILYFSTARSTVIHARDSLLSEYRLPDLSTARWHIETGYAQGAKVSTDGRYVFARNPKGELQFAELNANETPALRPLKTRMSLGEHGLTRLFVGEGLLAVVQGAMMEVVRLDALGKSNAPSQLLDWRTKP